MMILHHKLGNFLRTGPNCVARGEENAAVGLNCRDASSTGIGELQHPHGTLNDIYDGYI
jgi:hypothetical protein